MRKVEAVAGQVPGEHHQHLYHRGTTSLLTSHTLHTGQSPLPLCRQAQLSQITASDWFSRTRLRRIFSDSVQNSGVWSTPCPSQACYPARAMKIVAFLGHCWPLLWTGKKKRKNKTSFNGSTSEYSQLADEHFLSFDLIFKITQHMSSLAAEVKKSWTVPNSHWWKWAQ